MASNGENMKKFNLTINDLKKFNLETGIKYLITRLDSRNIRVSDLDVLIKKNDFKILIEYFKSIGYKTQSHDLALGGRIKGAQINLIKNNRLKIDLHKDFTWRKTKYIDTKLLWKKIRLSDEFLVFINIIFEKNYIDKDDYSYVWSKKDKIFSNYKFKKEAIKFGWINTFNYFKNWNPKKIEFPLFLPTKLLIISYLEKFELVSFLYNIFFRIRYKLFKILPYD